MAILDQPTGVKIISGRKSRKAKSGCKTCKIRKVKCDEARPACNRCISAGRVCDGYGIWGGGGNNYGDRKKPCPASPPATIALWRPLGSSVASANTSVNSYLEWFRERTLARIPGVFLPEFWTSLLMKTSYSERTILHAVLALSSVHKRLISNGDELSDPQEQFMLKQYSAAIQCVQDVMNLADERSVTISLVACIVFVYIEILRGRFRTARLHLSNGLSILKDVQTYPTVGSVTTESISTPRPLILPKCLLEAFSRLEFQVMLFEWSPFQDSMFAKSPTVHYDDFQSFEIAWDRMELLIRRIIHLNTSAITASATARPPMHLLNTQQQIQDDLNTWLTHYRASRDNLQHRFAHGSTLTYDHILQYSTLAQIQLHLALHPHPTLQSLTTCHPHFVDCMTQANAMWTYKSTHPLIRVLPGAFINMAASIVDLGWLAPLWCVAVQCRVHRVRCRAVRYLEASSHREGFWDAKICAAVARRVMVLEDGGVVGCGCGRVEVGSGELGDGWKGGWKVEECAGSEVMVPLGRWVEDVRVGLPDGLDDVVTLRYVRTSMDGVQEEVKEEFSMASQAWLL